MQVTLLSKEIGYIPSYKRSDMTDGLHKAFGFHTDYEFISKSDTLSIQGDIRSKRLNWIICFVTFPPRTSLYASK